VDKDDKKIRKVKKICLINIWPTYDQIDLRPVSQNEKSPSVFKMHLSMNISLPGLLSRVECCFLIMIKYYFLYLVCEAIGTAATLGLLPLTHCRRKMEF
jgi:hypothetical protein